VTILITGAAGFVGSHLAPQLAQTAGPVELFGLLRPGTTPSASWPRSMRSLEADLEDPARVDEAIQTSRPDRVYHLAAQSSPGDSWRDPIATLRTNVLGLAHLLEALRRHAPESRVLVVGSAEEYGAVDAESQPVGEDTPLRPASPYAVSKVSQGYLALQYALGHGMAVIRTRTFNHTGPGRGEGFAESSFAQQIAEIEAGLRPPAIAVGNLDAVRDFCDVRDVVTAYESLLEKGRPGEVYNVCSGRGVRIGDLLDRLLALSSARIEIRVDADRLRPVDIPALVGDPGRLRGATGWEARIPLERTLRDLLEHWRRRVKLGSRLGTPA
jgi:GDP-4-dehydro-6-deoxy-D-mannose reductase